ncbi:hypothetical protein [Microcoleus sp. FACHB-831]|nr:hypothetical protein [Microcoleus sp. FACHB-831]
MHSLGRVRMHVNLGQPLMIRLERVADTGGYVTTLIFFLVEGAIA